MRWSSVVRHTTALLSFSFLTMVASLIAITFLFGVFFQWTPNIIMSGSMEPLVKTGDIAIAKPLTTEEVQTKLQKGHVLLADNPAKPGNLLTHRIVEVKYDDDNNAIEFLTKGDANEKADSTPIPVENVKAVQQILVPKLGLPVQGIRTGNFIPVIVFITLVSLAWISAKKEWAIAMTEDKEMKRIKRSKESAEEKTDLDSSTEPSVHKKNKSGIRKVLTFFIIVVIVAVPFLLTGSSAKFSSSTVNPSCYFRTGVWTIPANTGCWSGDYVSEDYTIDMNPASGSFFKSFKGNLSLSLNSNGRDFSWRYTAPNDAPVDNTNDVVITATNVNGATVTSSGAFSSTKVASGTTSSSFDVSGNQITYTVDIRTQGQRSISIWKGKLILNRCSNYSMGMNANSYCWAKGAPPQGVKFNLPLNGTSTTYTATAASVSITYDADMLGFTWKAVFPETKAISANETFHVNATNTDGQNSVVISKPVTSNSVSGHVGIPVSKNVTFIGELFINSTKTHTGSIPITACSPETGTGPNGYNANTYCSTNANGVVSATFLTSLNDATTAVPARTPVNVTTRITYNLSLNSAQYTITFPAGQMPGMVRATVTNSAGVTATNTATLNTATNTATGNLVIQSLAGPQATFNIGTFSNRGAADRKATLIIKQCASS